MTGTAQAAGGVAPAMTTVFGTLDDYEKGEVQIIDDDPRNYVFSNVFDVAARSGPYERVAVAKNFEYVIEAARAEGDSLWYACAHDEFAVCMDGEVRVEFVKLDDPASAVDPESGGAHLLGGDPVGTPMGYVVIRRGHMTMLPVNAAYRFSATRPSVLMIQTIEGPVTVARWAEICQQA